MMMIRQNRDILTAPITNIINATISTDTYPDCLKENKLVQVAKQGARNPNTGPNN